MNGIVSYIVDKQLQSNIVSVSVKTTSVRMATKTRSKTRPKKRKRSDNNHEKCDSKSLSNEKLQKRQKVMLIFETI